MSDPQQPVVPPPVGYYAAPPPGYILVPLLPERPPAPPSNSIATAAIILGTIGFALSAIPLFGWVLAMVPALLAIIFGHVGHYLARARGGLNLHYAVGGWITGYLALIVAPIVWLIIYSVIGR